MEHVQGKLNHIADALSRFPVFQPEEQKLKDVLVQMLQVKDCNPQLKIVIEATESIADFQAVIDAVQKCLTYSLYQLLTGEGCIGASGLVTAAVLK